MLSWFQISSDSLDLFCIQPSMPPSLCHHHCCIQSPTSCHVYFFESHCHFTCAPQSLLITALTYSFFPFYRAILLSVVPWEFRKKNIVRFLTWKLFRLSLLPSFPKVDQSSTRRYVQTVGFEHLQFTHLSLWYSETVLVNAFFFFCIPSSQWLRFCLIPLVSTNHVFCLLSHICQ